MSRDVMPAVIASALIAGVLCLLIGAAGAYLLVGAEPAPKAPVDSAPEPDAAESPAPSADNSPARPAPGPVPIDATGAQAQIEKLRKGNGDLVAERDKLRQDNESLQQRLGKAENELNAIKALEASRRGKLAINFGGYGDNETLQNADWRELGAALHSMTPSMLALGEAVRAGKPPDRETLEKIQKDNMKLIKLAVALEGKLATNAGNVNGEYTHPVAQVNLLAAQLEALGDPLTADQKLKLAEFGEEYEKRWKVLQQGYNAETPALQKVLDEADLKMWFTSQMFSVTTPQQKAKVVDPSFEGVMGFDLYSPGLMLMPVAETVSVSAKDALKQKFKDWLAPEIGVARELLDGVEYAFDDWQGKFPLEPVTAAQARMISVHQVLVAGRAQLTLMQTLAATALSTPENLKKVRENRSIGVPQLVKQE